MWACAQFKLKSVSIRHSINIRTGCLCLIGSCDDLWSLSADMWLSVATSVIASNMWHHLFANQTLHGKALHVRSVNLN